MISRVPPYCLSCKHWVPTIERTDEDAQKPEPTQICAAYPLEEGGIPDAIWWNRADHRKPYGRDHGIQFEAREGMDFPDWVLQD